VPLCGPFLYHFIYCVGDVELSGDSLGNVGPDPAFPFTPGTCNLFNTTYPFQEFYVTSYDQPGTYTISAKLYACQATDNFADQVPTNILQATTTITITVLPQNEGSGADLGPCAPVCEAAVGQPINVMTGNTWIQHRDYSLPGLGGGLQLVRTWNSHWQDQAPVVLAGTFGDSWRSNYEEGLTFPDPNTVKYWRGDGSAWTFAFDNASQTYLLSVPSDQHAKAKFDTNSNLYTITFPDGTSKIFNSVGYLLSLVDRNNNQTKLTYDQGNRLTQVTDPAGRTVTLGYNDSNNPGQATTVQDAVGVIATYTYDTSSRLTQVTYADSSSLNFAYDGSSMITSVTDSLGKVLETHTYDTLHRGLTSSRANGVDLVSVDYTNFLVSDSLGHASSFDYQNIGGRHVLNDFVGSGCSSCGSRRIEYFTYDSQGNRTSSTDSLNRATNYTYDSSGNVLTKSQQLDGSTTLTWAYTYNQFSEVLTATDPAGNVTTNSYDANGNLLSTTTPSPDGTHPGSSTTFAYDAKGEQTQITDPLGNATTMTYTPAGLIASVVDAQHDSTSYAYDGRGNRTSVTDALGNTTNFAYDLMNRPTITTQPGGLTTSLGYDYRGRRTSVTDANGKITHYAYDDADHLVSVADAAGDVTSYAYDTENNLTKLTDALGHQSIFTYDPSGDVLTVTFVGGGQVYSHESYFYDEPGDLVNKIDRNGHSITYSYDNLGRLASKQYPDSTAVNYTYDVLNHLTQVADPTGTYSFTYDNLGRLTQTGTQYSFLSGHTLTNSYTYDANSNRASLINPQAGVTNYSYDTLDRLVGITDFASRTFGFSYDALSRRIALTRPNGVNTSYSYDNLSRLLSVLHQVGFTALDGAAYVYDAAGNRTSNTSLPSSLTYNYAYDPIYQLSQVNRNSDGKTTEKYTYDAVGDRLSSPGVPYTYDDQHEMTSREGVPYTYDDNGNTLSKTNGSGTTTYTWDFENRLTSVTLANGGVVALKYDPFGRRIYKNSPSGTTISVYDGDNIIEELDGSGNLGERYTYGPVIDEPLVGQRQPKIFYYEADGLGSVTSLTDSTGALAATYSYDSFGFLTNSTGSATNWFRYTARQFDSDTALYYYRARYYDPQAGRFVSEDPKRTTADINFYRYSLNSPINRTDPLGWESCQSGKCADCPGGRWVSGSVTAEAYASARFAGGGGLLFAGVMICTTNPTFNVPFTTLCGFGNVGLSPRPPLTSPPAKPIGIGWGLGGAALTCTGIHCRENLAGTEGGWFAQVGPAYYFKEGGPGGIGSCQGVGVGFELGLGGGGFKCKTWIGPSIGGVK
jgi:RHS repeat-associated protein